MQPTSAIINTQRSNVTWPWLSETKNKSSVKTTNIYIFSLENEHVVGFSLKSFER